MPALFTGIEQKTILYETLVCILNDAKIMPTQFFH